MSKTKVKSTSVKAPNQGGGAFWWAVLALVLVAALVVGFVVYKGQKAKEPGSLAAAQVQDVAMNVAVNEAEGFVALSGLTPKPEAKTVDLFEDFSCSYCSKLAIATDSEMKKAIENGDLIVNIHTLNFLDRGNQEGFSTRAGNAARILATAGDAAAYWNLRATIMEHQADILAATWSNDDLAAAARGVGAPEPAIASISAGEGVDTYLQKAQAGYQKLEGLSTTGQVGTPSAYYGKQMIKLSDTWVQDLVAAPAAPANGADSTAPAEKTAAN